MSMVTTEAHCPDTGVKIYWLVPFTEALTKDGFQVPDIPFCDVVGSTGACVFKQTGSICSNAGTIPEFLTSTGIDVTTAH